ncbi:MAG TPA: hypothetical protein VMV53_08570 [Acidimicrobiales bacterium]|nr:hypothetical protein [Acidimicrobiales bacterium]
MKIVTLCTGNVARSVMLGYMLTTIGDANGSAWEIRTAGTHVTEGLAMSGRTRDALLAIDELGEHRYGAHRSHQLSEHDVAWADIVLAAEADHVRYVRERHSPDDHRVVQLAQFVRYAPWDLDLVDQLLVVSRHAPDTFYDVADPAGGDQEVYNECARQLWDLAMAFATLCPPGPA